MSYFA
jgi:RNA recognition motif-containing protein